MKVNVEELSPVLRKVSVELPPETVDQAIDRAYRAVGRQARIKGFRPGKVPRRLLEQYYGHQVLHEVAEDLVRGTFAEALELEKVEAVAPPQIEESGHVHPGEAWNYAMKVEVLPVVQVTDFDGLPAETVAVRVSDEEVDGELERLRQSMAQLVPVEGREAAQAGDYVVADMEAFAGERKLEEGTGQGFTFEVGAGEITQGHLPAAEGRKVGEVVEVTQTFPEDHPNEALKGREVRFQATLKELKLKQLPAVDDELAKDLGEEGVEDLPGLREWIRGRISTARRTEADRRLKDSLVQSLVEKNPIDVPPAMVERASEGMIRPVLEQMIRAGLNPEQLGEMADIRRMLEEVRPRAELAVKGALLLKAVADKENLEVTDEDVEAHYAQLAEQTNTPVEKVRAVFAKDPEEKEALRRRLLEDKALAFIKERASITEVEPGKAEDGQVVGEGEPSPA